MLLWGGQNCQNIMGCHFENNKSAIHPGLTAGPTYGSDVGAITTISGCYFKNNGVALEFLNPLSSYRIVGCLISGDQTVTVYGERPQYGIQIGNGQGCGTFFGGINVTGQFDKYAISIGTGIDRLRFMGVSASNNSSYSPSGVWQLPTGGPAGAIEFVGCNQGLVLPVANLPVSGTRFVMEGDCYNVSDSSVNTWGSTVAGGGSTHTKVRWNGSNWTVMGK
jgi:hypothetical protein